MLTDDYVCDLCKVNIDPAFRSHSSSPFSTYAKFDKSTRDERNPIDYVEILKIEPANLVETMLLSISILERDLKCVFVILNTIDAIDDFDQNFIAQLYVDSL